MGQPHLHPGIGTAGVYTREEIMKITRETLAQHGHKGHSPQGGYSAKKIPDHVAKSNMPNTYPVELKTPLSDAVLDRMRCGVIFEDEIAAKLAACNDPSIVIIEEVLDENGERTKEGKEAKETATFEAYINPDVRFIFNARLSYKFAELLSKHLGKTVEDPDRVSEPDALSLGPVMPNGLRAVRFVDVKWHKTAAGVSQAKRYHASPLDNPHFGVGHHIDLPGALVRDDWMQLAHYYRHGQTLGICDDDASLFAAVIGKEEVLIWCRLDQKVFRIQDAETGKQSRYSALDLYDPAFANVLDVIDNAIARDLDPAVPALTFPEWSTAVVDTEWADVCLAELKAHGDGGHITLLPGVTPLRAMQFYQMGITSIGQLARLRQNYTFNGERIKDISAHVLQARVSYYDKPSSSEQRVNVPRADIEIDFDYEADHVVYQRGVRVTDRRQESQSSQQVYFEDFTGSDQGECEAFVAMWAKFTELKATAQQQGASLIFYHFSKYEKTVDRKLARKFQGQPGVPTVEEIDAFYDSANVVDLYDLLRSEIVWPTKSHSIKDLAKYIGFSWPLEGSNGADSIVWYRSILADADDKAELIARLEDYNGADTQAQLELRNWVSQKLEGRGFPLVKNLRPPAAK